MRAWRFPLPCARAQLVGDGDSPNKRKLPAGATGPGERTLPPVGRPPQLARSVRRTDPGDGL